MYCSPSGPCRHASAGSLSVKGSLSWGTSFGQALSATQRLRASAATSGTSCRQVYSADRQLAPLCGQATVPSSRICACKQEDPCH